MLLGYWSVLFHHAPAGPPSYYGETLLRGKPKRKQAYDIPIFPHATGRQGVPISFARTGQMPTPPVVTGVHLPPPPGVIPLFLDVLGLTQAPQRDVFASVPSIEELQSLSASIQGCVDTASTRSLNAREGIRLGHEVLAQSKRKLDDNSRGHVGTDARQKVKVKEEQDDRRTLVEEKQSKGGRVKSQSIRMTQSPTPKLERDASASPAATEDSHGYFDGVSAPASKRRKIGRVDASSGGVDPGRTGLAQQPGLSGNDADPRSTSTLPTIKLKVNTPSQKSASREFMDSASPAVIVPSQLASFIGFTLPPHLLPRSTASAGGPTLWHPSHPNDLSPRATLVPRRQAVPKPPKSGPKRQKDVNVDYSQPKPGAGSINWTTFWNFIEPYLKDIGEDDLAMLRFRSDDPHPFDMPRLGQHYQDVWDFEDSQLPFRDETASAMGTSGAGNVRPFDGGGQAAHNRKFIAPRDLGEDDLYDDARGLGNLTERVVAAMLTGRTADLTRITTSPQHNMTNGTVIAVAGGEARFGVTSASASSHDVTSHDSEDQPMWTEDQDGGGRLEARWPILPHMIGEVSNHHGHLRPHSTEISLDDLESGMRRELDLLGLVQAEIEIDWLEREDDEIAAALRQCQRLLDVQLAVNNARKDRLAGIVRDRLAHAEYKRGLDGLEKVIEAAWAKRSARKGRKGRKRDASNVMAHVPLDDLTKKAITTRQKWISTIGQALEAPDVQGRYTGLPEKSIFEGIDPGGKALVANEHVLTMK